MVNEAALLNAKVKQATIEKSRANICKCEM
jgi:hypothetical protein